VARLVPGKGLECFLRIAARIRGARSDVRFLIVGDGPLRRDLERLAETLGLRAAVVFTGHRTDVPDLMQAMDLFVLPSLFGEGLPMVVLEAMAAGVPVVATRVEGIPETIRDGRDGVLAKPGDPEDLARAIGRVVRGEADWASLRASALARHAEHFSDQSMAAGVAEVYRRVLAAGGLSRFSRRGRRCLGH